MKSVVADMLPDELKPAVVELCAYLEDSFGNSTRIDYGSGGRPLFHSWFMHGFLLLVLEIVLTLHIL